MTRVFVSFDYDHDRDLYGNLVGQARQQDSPFTITDQSLPNAVHNGDWKRQVRTRIRRADVVVFICSANTHSAKGVEAEMSLTHEEGKSYFLLAGRSRQTCSKPRNARSTDAMEPWTWPNLKRLLHRR